MRQETRSSDREVLADLVERVTFHNAENGFCVLRIKARGHRDLATVVGYAATISAGEWVTASGEWVNDRTHGQKFRARFPRTSEPSSADLPLKKWSKRINGATYRIGEAARVFGIDRKTVDKMLRFSVPAGYLWISTKSYPHLDGNKWLIQRIKLSSKRGHDRRRS